MMSIYLKTINRSEIIIFPNSSLIVLLYEGKDLWLDYVFLSLLFAFIVYGRFFNESMC